MIELKIEYQKTGLQVILNGAPEIIVDQAIGYELIGFTESIYNLDDCRIVINNGENISLIINEDKIIKVTKGPETIISFHRPVIMVFGPNGETVIKY